MPEIIGTCDRCYVINEGEIAGELTKEGRRFLGWYAGSSIGDLSWNKDLTSAQQANFYEAGAEVSFTKNTTLLAVWKNVGVKVSYDMNGAWQNATTPMTKADASFDYGKASTNLGSSGANNEGKAKGFKYPDNKDYTGLVAWYDEATETFYASNKGWYTLDKTNTVAQEDGSYALALTAVWGYTPVVYHLDDETIERDFVTRTSSGTKLANWKLTTTAAIARDAELEGHTFKGWATEPNGEVVYEAGAEITVVKAIDLYPVYEINQYTLSFVDEVDGEIVTTYLATEYDYGTPAAEMTKPADPTKENFVFAGWDSDLPATMPAEDVVIRATWADAVAKITRGETTTYYATLAAAVEAAEDGDTIELLANITNENIIVAKEITLDLAGYEVKSDAIELFYVTADGDLTITGNGTITGPANGQDFDGKAVITVNAGKLTMEDGTLTATGTGSDGMYGVYVLNGGTAIFEEPTITSWFAAIGTNNTTAPATIEVNGGTYTALATPASEAIWWSYFCAPIYAASAGEYTINGGVFNGYYGISSRYVNVEQTISLGEVTMNASSGTQVFVDEKTGSAGPADRTIESITNELTLPAGYAWLKVEDNKYVVAKAVAKIGRTNYATLAAAVEAAEDGDIIELLANITNENIIVAKEITLDLAGYEVKSDAIELFYVTADGDLTITGNGTITGPANGQDFDGKAVITVNAGKLTMEDGTLTATGTGSDGMYGVYVLNGGTAIFEEPTITSWFAAIGTNNTTAPATIEVNGGTYTALATPASEAIWWSYFCAPIYAASAGEYTINGGVFNGYYGISSRYVNVEQTISLGEVTMNASSGTQVFVDEKTGSAGPADRTIESITNELTLPAGYAWLKVEDNKYVVAKEVTVTFVDEKHPDATPDEQKLPAGAKAEKPEDPAEVEHFTFMGWFETDEDGNLAERPFDFNTAIEADITLTAKWVGEIVYVVYIDPMNNNKQLGMYQGNYGGDTPELPEDKLPAVPEGYRLAEDNLWTPEWSATVVPAEGESMIIYSLNWIKVHKVTFQKAGDMEDDIVIDVDDGETIGEAPVTPEEEGKAFAGWYNGNNLFVFGEEGTKVNDDLTLTAKWASAEFTYSIVLKESIDIKFYARNLMAGTDPADYTVTYQFNGYDAVERQLTSTDVNEFVIAECAAKQMTEKVHVTVKYKDTVIHEADYSVQGYCLYNIETYGNDVSKKSLVDLCKATLDYGRYAQDAFTYKTDDLANGGNDYNANIAGTEIPNDPIVKTGSATGITGVGASLVTTSRTVLKVNFKHAADADVANYKFTLGTGEDAVELNDVEVTASFFKVSVAMIAAKDLDERFTVNVTNTETNETFTVELSAVTYMSAVQNSATQGMLFKAMYLYHIAAKEYFE